MLIDRRRQLGLSVSQASKVLKLKEQVLVAFEEGDFANIPKSGYAQGMLSSYARYLGLNPREVVDQFTEDLFEYSNGVSSHELRRRSRENRSVPSEDPSYELPANAQPRPGVASDSNMLPHAGDGTLDTNDSFEPTSPVRVRGRQYRPQQSPPAGGRSRDAAGYPQGRPYTGRSYASQQQARGGTSRGAGRPGSSGRQARGRDDATPRDGRGRQDGRGYSRGDILTRDVRPRQYTDDMRYDDQARPYEAASTRSGRQSSRNIASTQRPNVQRRAPRQSRQQLRSREQQRPPRHQGVLGVLEAYFSNGTRTVVTILVVLALVLTLIIISSVRSCAASQTSTGKSVSVSSATTTSASSSASTTTDEEKAAEAQALSDAAAKSAAASSAAASTETDVTVSVADGAVTWLEIDSDGASKIAETVTGPWEQTYVVTQSITVQAGDTSAVTVTKNGSQVQFDSKSSGVGSVTVEGTSTTATSATF